MLKKYDHFQLSKESASEKLLPSGTLAMADVQDGSKQRASELSFRNESEEGDLELLLKCFEPLLKFKQKLCLQNTIHGDLLSEVKESVSRLRQSSLLSSPKLAGGAVGGCNKKTKTGKGPKGAAEAETSAQSEIMNLSGLVTRIETMNDEASRVFHD